MDAAASHATPGIRRALIAVYDKTGIAEFARALHDEFGIEIISTGGTAKHLQAAGIPVTLVEQVTGFPELLDGRVKTLHPHIHAAILADRDNPEHMRQLAEHGIQPIDMVVVNLYPFEKTVADPTCRFEDAIEMIDIGGPCLLRAAAKNHRHVVVIPNQELQAEVLGALREDSQVPPSLRLQLASDSFDATHSYDSSISTYFIKQELDGIERVADALLGKAVPLSWFDTQQKSFMLVVEPAATLRYGENPHQQARLFGPSERCRSQERVEPALIANPPQGGREMSFNNFLDADAALRLCHELHMELGRNRGAPRSVACAFIKHGNPCGVAVGADWIDVYARAYLGDPKAAMGGILAQNQAADRRAAEAVLATLDRWGRSAGAGAFFVEVWLAPSFTEDAISLISNAKKWGGEARLLSVGSMGAAPDPTEVEFRALHGDGILVQSADRMGLGESEWKVVTRRSPDERELADLRLAWLVAKHTKSNAISLCRNGMLIGNGAGQMSRVMSCRIATWLASENGHADKLPGSVAASDAFFPFRDGPDLLLDAGVTAIIQPGGSKRDDETIRACDERGAAMIFTGTRHFRH